MMNLVIPDLEPEETLTLLADAFNTRLLFVFYTA
jgi:hypothetical protein